MSKGKAVFIAAFITFLGIIGPYRVIGISNFYPYLLAIFICIYEGFNKTWQIPSRMKIYLFLNMASLLVMLISGIGYNYDFITLGSGLDNLLRTYCLLFVGYYIKDRDMYSNVLVAILLICLAMSVLSFVLPNMILKFYELWYDDPTKAIQSIRMGRNIAVFASPTGLGYFSLLGIMYFMDESLKIKNRKMIVILGVILGLLSISKTYIFGLLLIIIYYLMPVGNRKLRNRLYHIIGIIIIASSITYLLKEYLPAVDNSFSYLLDQVTLGASALGDRYQNALVGMQEKIKEIFPFGAGFAKGEFENEFIGDSGYLLILLWGGVTGFILYYLSLLVLSISSREIFQYILLGLAVEIGRPAFWGTRASDVLWIIIGLYMSDARSILTRNN